MYCVLPVAFPNSEPTRLVSSDNIVADKTILNSTDMTVVKYGSTMTLQCVSGYKLSNDFIELTLRCESDGNWQTTDVECTGNVFNTVHNVFNTVHKRMDSY